MRRGDAQHEASEVRCCLLGVERRCHGAKGCLAGVEQQAARLVERESLLGCRRIQCRLASAEQSVAQLAYCSDGVEQSADDQLV